MRVIRAKRIEEAVSDLCAKANFILRKDVARKLVKAKDEETAKNARKALESIINNFKVAAKDKIAICQDTGLPIVFVELGQDVLIRGDFKKAILTGIESGYRNASLRESVIKNPISRGKSSYKGAVIHTDIVKGSKIKITVLSKGFGCENKSQIKMFLPTASLAEIERFIIDCVRSAGGDACPPYFIGVGIGGTADFASLLSKKALLKDMSKPQSKIERTLLGKINKLNIGPMGLGGKSTCLAVNIITYPTHIAGLPVAVNISCHALRSATKTL